MALAAMLVAGVAGLGLWRSCGSTQPAPDAAHSIGSLAVLPLTDLSADASDDYFAAGLTEALITRLARIHDLRVISPTSAEALRGSNEPPVAMAATLEVDAWLEGSVVQAGERVRVSVQLIEAATRSYLWAQEYDRDLSDILHVHAAIAGAVAEAVRVRLTPGERERLARTGAVDTEAYRLYLRGRFHWNRRTTPDLEQSLRHFERAVELDPGYAPAHAGLADALLLLSTYYALPPEEAFPSARRAAERALAIDPDLPEAHASLGAIHLSLDWDLPAAEASYREALDRGPGYATAHQWYGELLSVMARHQEAVAASGRARALDPLSPIINASLGQRLNAAGRWEEALEQFRHTLELEPRFAWIRREMAYAETHLGRTERALEQRRLEMEVRGVSEGELTRLASAIETDGMTGFWRWELERLERRSSSGFVPALLWAEAYEGAGDRERAIDALHRAVTERGDHVLQFTTSPELASLSDDARAVDLLVAAGLRPLEKG